MNKVRKKRKQALIDSIHRIQDIVDYDLGLFGKHKTSHRIMSKTVFRFLCMSYRRAGYTVERIDDNTVISL